MNLALKSYLFLLTILAFGLRLPAHGGELQLPENIGTLQFIGRTDYDDPRMGYSLRYQNDHLLKADVYVYDKGIADLPDGSDSTQVFNELANVTAALKHVEQMGKYKDVRQLKEGKKSSADLKTEFLWARHSYHQTPREGVTFTGERISDSYLTVAQGKFVKIRLTSKAADLHKHQKEMSQFVKEVSKQLEKESAPK